MVFYSFAQQALFEARGTKTRSLAKDGERHARHRAAAAWEGHAEIHTDCDAGTKERARVGVRRGFQDTAWRELTCLDCSLVERRVQQRRWLCKKQPEHTLFRERQAVWVSTRWVQTGQRRERKKQ